MINFSHFDERSLKKSQTIMFFLKSHIKKKPPAGKLATEVRTGDAPKPPFAMNNYEKSKKSGTQPLNRQSYFLVCYFGDSTDLGKSPESHPGLVLQASASNVRYKTSWHSHWPKKEE